MRRETSAWSDGWLERPGRKIVIIEPIPLTGGGFNPLSCISEGSPSKCAYQANLHPTPLEQYYRHTGLKSVYSLDLDRWVCPRWPTCDAIVGNIIVKRDVSHLTATFARSLYPRLVTLLQDDGILKRP